ncbi:MAG: hypothetical protein Q8N81_06430 [bacterium]|nr:hypothetical protein [bacterium]
MSKKFIIIILISHFAAIGVGVYGGMKYGQNKIPTLANNTGGFANLSPAEMQARLQQFGAGANGARGTRTNNGGGFVNGEIIAKDTTSITVKLPNNGGSKIVFYSNTTQIGKLASGTPNNLEIGKTVTINGQANSDGSITGQSIQIRP